MAAGGEGDAEAGLALETGTYTFLEERRLEERRLEEEERLDSFAAAIIAAAAAEMAPFPFTAYRDAFTLTLRFGDEEEEADEEEPDEEEPDEEAPEEEPDEEEPDEEEPDEEEPDEEDFFAACTLLLLRAGAATALLLLRVAGGAFTLASFSLANSLACRSRSARFHGPPSI